MDTARSSEARTSEAVWAGADQEGRRHAHLAGAVKLEFVNSREGKIAKAVLPATLGAGASGGAATGAGAGAGAGLGEAATGAGAGAGLAAGSSPPPPQADRPARRVGTASHHLGYAPGADRPAEADNHRKGRTGKTVLTEDGPLRIEVPGDREAASSHCSSPSMNAALPASSGLVLGQAHVASPVLNGRHAATH